MRRERQRPAWAGFRPTGRRDGRMIARFKDLCMDAVDAPVLAGFWARILDGEVVDTGDGDARVDVRPGGAGPEPSWVNQVPEPRTGKTPVHLDLRLADADPTSAPSRRVPPSERRRYPACPRWTSVSPSSAASASPSKSIRLRPTPDPSDRLVIAGTPLCRVAGWAGSSPTRRLSCRTPALSP
ncbi:VOC family protein [Micromonospora inositola]|uniref:Glyoxalase-like domain-containing protein n=1 Tax=Micromonospora inositola TaxID=47865 RepID=A0A1C5J3C5_9ACTN|nr:hypothetical protein GA0070613_3941 [Micromonospora inositola]